MSDISSADQTSQTPTFVLLKDLVEALSIMLFAFGILSTCSFLNFLLSSDPIRVLTTGDESRRHLLAFPRIAIESSPALVSSLGRSAVKKSWNLISAIRLVLI
jgi:hypothetical protein